jgi:regulator of sigma E protease
MNLFTAWVLFSLLALVGVPKLPLPGGEEQFTVASDTTVVSNKVLVGYVEPDGPADKAGLRTGDEIKGFNCSFTDSKPQQLSCEQGTAIEQAAAVRTETEELVANGNASLNVIISRDDAYQLLVVYPRSMEEVEASRQTDTPKGYLGVVPQDFTIQRSTWSAPIVGAGLIAQYSRLTYQAIGSSIASLFQGKGGEASENVAGPVGIFFVLKDGATLGLTYILLIVASLSLTLAIMNTLPIPALDGGKLAVMLIFRAIKKPLTPELEEKIHGSGFVLLMGLFILITVVDIRRFF